jgi:hypothetical protein
VDNEADFEEIIKEEFSKKWPCIIELRFSVVEENIFPMVPPWNTLWQTLNSVNDNTK